MGKALRRPTDFGTEQWRAELALVREHRRIFGVKSARALWNKLELPDVLDRSRQSTLLSVLDPKVLHPDQEHIVMFVAQCCEDAPGCRVNFKDVWTSYLQWCETHGELPVSKKSLGLTLRRQYRRLKSNGCCYIGFMLRQSGRRQDCQVMTDGKVEVKS